MQEVIHDIGGRLRRAREGRGLSLRDAANATRLPIDVLHAIERNDFDRLPPGMYRKAYVRTLASEVGLDPDDIAADYSRLIEPPHDPPDDERRQRQEQLVRQLTSPPPWSLLKLAVFVVFAAGFVFQTKLFPIAIPAGDASAEVAGARAPLEATGVVPLALRPAAIMSDLATKAVRIELQASDRCWVAAEVDGRRVVYRLVQPGEQLAFEADRLISVRLGDAGSVRLSINDGEPRSPGRRGEVVQFDVTADNATSIREALERRQLQTG